ncbi:adherens junction-associated protein 1 isoform X2 [Megalops cyprinoides]|uniref:adherens junction-associated protein 1 isoform X2 n=1 Tax=Megalops cyprinoides TaxID=118141 RepID=UPI001864B341|nr:adherens junction-associated protein 1 isoform X2 [Megalops cyprinoides]
MWIKRIVARSSMSALRSGSLPGRHAWILLAMIHLTMDFSFCSPLTQGPVLKLLSKPVPRHRAGPAPLWDPSSRPHWRALGPWWQRALRPALQPGDKGGKAPTLASQKHITQRPTHRGSPCKECQSKHSSSEVLDSLASPGGGGNSDTVTFLIRPRRQLKWDSYERSQDSRTTTVPGFIDWGPTGGEDGGEDDGKVVPNSTVSTKALTTTVTTTIATTTKRYPQTNYAVVTTMYPRRQSTTQSGIITGETAKPPKPFGDTAGLAVHQIITITVSLIMVIAALITTLVLKNCCAQSGNGRHNSHQRKINQQEESCQNLTDFTPARVPSNVDIFTAYNDSLQCSHECVRTAVPVYTDEMIQQAPVYKTSYNGNRPSPTERQLIPVAFVSEKWFEISC